MLAFMSGTGASISVQGPGGQETFLLFSQFSPTIVQNQSLAMYASQPAFLLARLTPQSGAPVVDPTAPNQPTLTRVGYGAGVEEPVADDLDPDEDADPSVINQADRQQPPPPAPVEEGDTTEGQVVLPPAATQSPAAALLPPWNSSFASWRPTE